MKQLAALGWLVAAAAAFAARRAADVRFTADPFTLGVASGYPTANDVVLWTRLAPSPMAPGGGMPSEVVTVEWELASDPQFRQRRALRARVRGAGLGTQRARRAWRPRGRAGPYWYRFTAGGVRSPVGRTATAPARDATPERLRLAVASCQQYEHGYYTAYQGDGRR